jgi:hypothetical protein
MGIRLFFSKHHAEIKKHSFRVALIFVIVTVLQGAGKGADALAYWMACSTPIWLGCAAFYVAAVRANK